MRGNQHGRALVTQLFDDLNEHRLAALVHAGERLIQQQQLGALGDSACHEGALTLTARERPNLTVGKVGQFHAGERLIHGSTVCGTQAAGDAEVAVASHADDLTHGDGEGPVDFFALRHVADESSAVVVRVLAAAATVTADGLPVEGDATGVHGHDPHDGFEEGGFAGAVHANQAADTPGVQGEGCAGEGTDWPVVHVHIFAAEKSAHSLCSFWWSPYAWGGCTCLRVAEWVRMRGAGVLACVLLSGCRVGGCCVSE